MLLAWRGHRCYIFCLSCSRLASVTFVLFLFLLFILSSPQTRGTFPLKQIFPTGLDRANCHSMPPQRWPSTWWWRRASVSAPARTSQKVRMSSLLWSLSGTWWAQCSTTSCQWSWQWWWASSATISVTTRRPQRPTSCFCLSSSHCE